MNAHGMFRLILSAAAALLLLAILATMGVGGVTYFMAAPCGYLDRQQGFAWVQQRNPETGGITFVKRKCE